MGIEPTYSAWKAEVLPLNYTRKTSLIFELTCHKIILKFCNITFYLVEGGGLFPASCLPPFGPDFVCTILLPAILSNLLSVQILPIWKDTPTAKSTYFLQHHILFGGGGRIRTSEGRTSRFTICPLWPLGNPSKNQAAYFA